MLAVALVASAAAQAPLSPASSVSNPVMGFETPASWTVTSTSPTTKVASTTTRTQGNFAFALINPPEVTTLTSQAVPSTASALAGIDTNGAVFELDVMPPPSTTGSLKLTLNSPSRGLKGAAAGEAQLQGLIPGTYNTVKFVIPDTVSDALGGASFSDLTFQLVLTAPASTASRQFLFDNLRVSAVSLVTATTGAKPPAGFGGSVDLFAVGATPVSQVFPIGPVQVPDSFHLEEGTTGTTTVQLALGHDGSAAFTCTYEADSSDKTHESYILHSCTGGLEAGDIIGANFAELTIVGGTTAMKLRPQLALNPVGSLVGRKIIPAMPTFWGSFEGCSPTPPAGGKVQPASPSCAAQLAQASKIVTDYFNKVSASNAPFNVIVTPIGDFARRRGDGAPHIVHTTTPTTTAGVPASAAPQITRNAPTGACAGFPQPSDFPHDDGSHMNQGGNFDAFWALHTDMQFGNAPNGDTCTHFEADLSADAVVFGQDVNVLSVNANADTTSGSTPSANASLHMFLFGIELPGGGSADASTGFNFNLSKDFEFDLPPIRIWIFSITPGVKATVGMNTSGTLAATGVALTVTPNASVGAHALGGIDIPGNFSGGIDARVDLLDFDVTLTARADWSINTNPLFCSAGVDFFFTGDMNISSGGGDLELTASIGPCPFCWSDSWPILHWPPILSHDFTLFEFGGFPLPPVPLPVGLCTFPLTFSITNPVGTVGQGAPQSLSSTFSGNSCTEFQWDVIGSGGTSTLASGQDTLGFSSPGCATKVTFNPVGPRTVQLDVTAPDITDQFGRVFHQKGHATSPVNVVALPAGVNIVATIPVNSDNIQPLTLNNQFLNFLVGSFPTTIQLIGEVVDFPQAAVIWTATDSSGNTTAIGVGNTVNWTVPSPGGFFTITMGASDSHFNPIGTATMTANVELTPR